MESTRRQSKKRDAIREILLASYDHPSVEEIYRRLKPDIPDLSLGTVYRNLAALSVSGEILSLSVGDGFEHFDGNAAPHAHLHCRSCGKIFDAPVHGDPLADIARANGFEPETSIYIEYGVCEKCKKTN